MESQEYPSRLPEEEAIQLLIAALKSEKATVRAQAAERLGAREDERAFEPLTSLLDDKAPLVRRTAVLALSYFEPKKAQPFLIDALHDEDQTVREVVAAVFARGWHRGEPVLMALLAAAQDPVFYIRVLVIHALGEQGDVGATPALLGAMQSQSDRIRTEALQALHKLHGTYAIPFYLRALQDHARSVRECAARILADLGDRRTLIIALVTDSRRSPAEQLEILERMRQIHFKSKGLVLNYRATSVWVYCRALLAEDLAPEVRQGVEAIQAEMQARQDRGQLLRGSEADTHLAEEELLRAHSGSGGSVAEELLRASDDTVPNEPNASPSWLRRLLLRR